jgi:hypothetical protein
MERDRLQAADQELVVAEVEVVVEAEWVVIVRGQVREVIVFVPNAELN